MSDIHKLLATDETFREVADLLFGGGGDELIAKMNPEQSDVGSKGGMSDRKKRALTAGLSGVGATAGAAGLGLAVKETAHGVKHAPKGLSTGGKLMHAAKSKKLATALIPLEVAGLGGELMATKILHGDAKKPVKKDLGLVNNAREVKGKLTQARIPSAKARKKGLEYTKKTGGKFRRLPSGAR